MLTQLKIMGLTLMLSVSAVAQTWHWARKNLVVDGIPTLPMKTTIDSKNNIVSLSLKLDRQIVSKHDIYGNLLWKRELFIATSNSLTGFCVDGFDNIYLLMGGPVSKIDTITVNTPAPFSLIKLNSNGKFLWAKKIDYTPALSFAPPFVSSGDRLYLELTMYPFKSLTYEGVTYDNIGGNTSCGFLAAMDTAGAIIWFRRMYSPARPITCMVTDPTPYLSVNANRDLFLIGAVTDKLMVETTAVIDSPFICRHFDYSMVINGDSGEVKWAKELFLDTLVPKPNLNVYTRRVRPLILPNGYSIVYAYQTQDTTISVSTTRIVEISNKAYLFDRAGNLIRKDSLGRRDTGWHEMFEMRAGDNQNFYSVGVYHGFSPGNIIETQTFEARKWDTLFTTVWKKNTVYSEFFPYFTPLGFYYRNNALSILMQCGSESPNGYAYFGADSIMPYQSLLFTRLVDSSNFIGGNIFIDLNKNGVKDNGEPSAAHVLVGSATGDTIYTSTRSNGLYEVILSPGSYDIKPLNLASSYPNFTVVTPPTHSATFAGYGNYLSNKNFALSANSIFTDGKISITSSSIPRAGANVSYRISVMNTGTTNFDASYKVYFDTSKITYQNSQQPAIIVDANTLNFPVSNLSPFGSYNNNIQFQVKQNLAIGDTIKVKADLNTSPTDNFNSNNFDSSLTKVRGPFDPNSKAVYPSKDVIYDSVIAGKQELDYVIYFQNTGNDTAISVEVLDTLDAKLDLTSFHLISSSHPVDVIWKRPNIIGFYFSSINLPDSNRNEGGSHGFVRFKIKPRININLTDIVDNVASIYFDYNSPVKTNITNTNFISHVITAVRNNIVTRSTIEIRPNPARSNLYFKVTTNNIRQKMVVSIFDESGRLVFNATRLIVTDIEQAIDIGKLPKGVYYLELNSNKGEFLKKFVH